MQSGCCKRLLSSFSIASKIAGTYFESGHLESNSKFVLFFMLPFFQKAVSYRSEKKSVMLVLNGYSGVVGSAFPLQVRMIP